MLNVPRRARAPLVLSRPAFIDAEGRVIGLQESAPSLAVLARGAEVARRVIYGLIDPTCSDRVRYVGKAENPAVRLAQHVYDARRGDGSRRSAWIRDLLAADRYPDMVLLQYVPEGADSDPIERSWILRMRSAGCADLNGAVSRRGLGGAA